MTEEVSFDTAAYHIERGFLQSLSHNAPDEAMRELAGEILAGNLTWAQAARSMAYGEVLTRAMEPVLADPRLLSPEAVAGWEAEAHAFVAKLEAEDGLVIVGLPARAIESRPATGANG